jgi:hypothetical protein
MQFCKSSQEVKNKTAFAACSSRLFPHTDTLHQPVETGKKTGEMTQQIKTFFHNYHRVFIWNENGRGIHEQHSFFKQ